MKDRWPALTPFIYFARGLRVEKGFRFALDRLSQRTAYVLLAQRAGVSVLRRGKKSWDLKEPGVALCQPGTAIKVLPGSVIGMVAFDLFDRPRAYHSSGATMIDATTDPQPSWHKAFGWSLDPVLPKRWSSSGRMLVWTTIEEYWRGPLAFCSCNAQLLSWVGGILRERWMETRGDDTPVAEALVLRARQVMVSRSRYGITVAEVAEAVGLSRNRLTELFREHQGMTPGKFIQELQLDEACRLLAETDASLAAVASGSGLGSVPTLCRRFQQAFGQSPRQWARLKKAGILRDPSE